MRTDNSVSVVLARENPLLGVANLISSARQKIVRGDGLAVGQKVATFANTQGLLDTSFPQG